MAIELTAELDGLKAQAEGRAAFVTNRLYERLIDCVSTPEYWRWSPGERLALGYYICARQRHAELSATASADERAR